MEKPTILVIDDEPSNIQIIINIFKESGFDYKVLSSSSSTLGVEIAIQAKPDIIITDWEMPEMTGIEVIVELKRNPITKEIPIIMATGVKITSADLKIALECGAFDFIRKPIDSIELIARTNTALKFIEYYSQKLEHEKQINTIREENIRSEMEAKKKELLSKTLMLIQLNQQYEKFQESINSFSLDDCGKSSCKFVDITKAHAKEMIASANKQVWSELELHFEQINETFYTNLLQLFPNLTPNEKKLAAYLRLNLSTKDIATITFQSQRSIEMARIRLRQKLGLTGTEEDLHSFLMKF